VIILRRLALLTITLIVAVTLPSAVSSAGTSSTSVEVFNHLGLQFPVAIAGHGKYLWIADLLSHNANGQVVRVNARTGAHLSITSPLIKHPTALISDGTYVWIVNGNHFSPLDPTISRIDIATNKVRLVAKLPSPGFGVTLTIAGRYLWVAGITNGSLLRINRSTLSMTKVASKHFHSVGVLTSDKNYLWVACSGGGPLERGSLARVSLRTGVVQQVDSPYFNEPSAVTSNGTSVWMPASNHVVVKVNIATNGVTKISSKSFEAVIGIGSTPRNVYVLSEYGNVSTGGGNLTQINAATNATKDYPSKYFLRPKGLALLGSHLWVIGTSGNPLKPITHGQLIRVTP
jgi:hypothetical protein